MECNNYQKFDEVQKLAKHGTQLGECMYHRATIQNRYARVEEYCRAEKYVRDTYNDLRKEEPLLCILENWTSPNLFEPPIQTLKRRLDILGSVLGVMIARDVEKMGRQ